MLSAIIITQNEEKNIKACLDSIKNVADEIIIVDSGSTDQTKELSQAYPRVKFYEFSDWQGFGKQKNRALSKASGDWILSIDADEIVSKELGKEILESLRSNSVEAYYFPRLSHLCKIPVRSCGWYPDYVLRLFKKESAEFSSSLVHECLVLHNSNTKTKKLKNDLIHYSYQEIEALLAKTNRYSTISAQEKRTKQKKIKFISIILRACFEFFKSYFLQRGFLDGKVGLIVSIMKTEAVYYKYLKLYFLNQADEQ